MERSYLIRYGLMGQVGRFTTDPDATFERGQAVVIRSHRGTERGEVLAEVPASGTAGFATAGTARVLRAAGADDLERSRQVDSLRETRFAACRDVFAQGVWPIELIDAEPLLDEGRTVLYYLGPHRLDVAGILAAFRAATDLDVMLEPVGPDVPDEAPDPADGADDPGCGACSSGGGGCGSGGGCGTAAHDGCAGCGVRKLIAHRP